MQERTAQEMRKIAFDGMVESRKQLETCIKHAEDCLADHAALINRMRKRAVTQVILAVCAAINGRGEYAFLWGCVFAGCLFSLLTDYLSAEREYARMRKLPRQMREDLKAIDADIEEARMLMETVQ